MADEQFPAAVTALEEYHNIEQQMAEPEVASNPDKMRKLGRRHAELGAIVSAYTAYKQVKDDLEAAREMGLVLRYVARFDANGKARVGVEAVREEHPLAALLPCDNVFAIESRWYRDNPLVIRGPGAGRDVTAGAIQSDINRLAQLL